MDRIVSVIGFTLIFFLCASLCGSMAALSEPTNSALIPSSSVLASLGESMDILSSMPEAILPPLQEIGSALQQAYLDSTKEIRVSLSLQVLYLVEGGRIQATFPILTGQQGMETPPGQYEVLSKSPVTDMEGAIGTPLEYHVKNVPWCLFFIGRTYAIHGNYWKPEEYFGKQPTWTGSHGCVGLMPDNARQVYDWASVGTKITIEE